MPDEETWGEKRENERDWGAGGAAMLHAGVGQSSN